MSFILKEGVVPTTFEELDVAVAELFMMGDISPNTTLSSNVDINSGEVRFSITVNLTEYHNGDDIDYAIYLTKKYSEDDYKNLTINKIKRELIAELWVTIFADVLRVFKMSIGGEESVSSLSRVG